MIYEWLYASICDWGDKESCLIVVCMSLDTQAILGHPLAPNHCMSSSLIVPLSVLWLLFGLHHSTLSVQADKVIWVRAWHGGHWLMLLPVLKCCLFSRPSNCSLRGSVTLVPNACPVTCKIGLKRLVCPRISDPRPRHAFPETGCAINIRTIESFINNTLVMIQWLTKCGRSYCTVRNSGCG